MQPCMANSIHWQLQIDMMPECNEIQDAMNEITGGRTVPRVFVGGKFIGEQDGKLSLPKPGTN